MMRQGLRGILESYPDIEVVGEACDGLEAIIAMELLHPRVVLIDVNMPKMNGVEAPLGIRSDSRIEVTVWSRLEASLTSS